MYPMTDEAARAEGLPIQITEGEALMFVGAGIVPVVTNTITDVLTELIQFPLYASA